MGRIENVDIEGVAQSFTETLDGVSELVRSPEVDRTLVAAREALQAARRLIGVAEPGVRPVMNSIEATGAEARASLRRFDAALADIEALLDVHGPLTIQLRRTLSDIGDAARSVNGLAEYLERNPNALVVGRPAS
jgi:paraquat-inducible protein B